MMLNQNLIGKGEIYMIISPNGKKYIGQCICYYKTKQNKIVKKGLEKRWTSHIWYAKKFKNTILAKNILKYGEKNFRIKTLLICDIKQLNYFEYKYIRQYNTLKPNGLNMVNGGGVHSGEGNPNYGKKTSEEAKQKMREKLTGRKLPESVRDNMRKAAENKIQPRRKHNDLPKYIYHVVNSKLEGYEVRHYPNKPNRKFASMKLKMEEKLELAINYLNIHEEGPET